MEMVGWREPASRPWSGVDGGSDGARFGADALKDAKILAYESENRIRSHMRERRPKSFSQVRTCVCRTRAGDLGIVREPDIRPWFGAHGGGQ